MSAMRRRRPDPMLMGEPSPGLAKINKMNMEQLAERIKALQLESAHLGKKIENLSNLQPRDEERIAALGAQQARLAALVRAAEERLSGKAERRQQRDAGGGRSYRR